MKTRRLPFAFATAFVAALSLGSLVACAPEADGDEETGESNDEINGSLSEAQGCAVRAAYLAADVDDFYTLRLSELPFQTTRTAVGTTYAKFLAPVAGIGTVYLVEGPVAGGDAGAGSIYGELHDGGGRVIAAYRTALAGSTNASFFLPGRGALTCSNTPPRPDGGPRPDASFDGGPRPDASFDGGPRPDASFDGGPRPDASSDGGPRPDASFDASAHD